ncbi:MAG: O-antigen ligase family protein [Candidatus Omnitrophota bacterium]|jgi:hypothetical protein
MKDRISRSLFFMTALLVAIIPLMFNTPEKPLFGLSFAAKLQVFDIFFMLLFFVWIVKLLKKEEKFYFFKYFWILIFYLVSCALSLLNSADLNKSLVEFIAMSYGVFIFVVFLNVLKDKRSIEKLILVWLITSVVISALGLLGFILATFFNIKTFLVKEYMDFPYIGHIYRVYSTFLINAKFLSSYLTIAIPFTVTFLVIRDKIDRRWLKIALLLFFLVLFLTFSRGWLGISIALYLVLRHLQPSRYVNAMKIFLLGFIVIFGISILLVSRWEVANIKVNKTSYINENFADNGRSYPLNTDEIKGFDIHFDYLDTAYSLLKKASIRMWLEKPFFGIGVGMYNDEIVKLENQRILPRHFRAFDPHSTFLGQLSQTGLIGFSALCLLWFFMFKKIMDCSKIAKEAGEKLMLNTFFAVGIGFLVQSMDMDIMNFRFVWFFFALAFSYSVAIVNKYQGGQCAH